MADGQSTSSSKYFILKLYTSSVRTSQETRDNTATKPNLLMLFVVKTIWNTQIHSVGRMQIFCVLKQLV
jgi:hypothetical protein